VRERIESSDYLAIHHEPGLFLNMGQPIPEGFDIGRLATIPHGDAALALGKSSTVVPPAVVSIPAVNGLPIGVRQDLTSGYLEPYKFFQDNPFKGNVTAAGFPGFNPVAPHELLQLALDRFKTKIKKTTILDLDTTNPTAASITSRSW
jgi:hypothetical protein